MSHKRRAPNMLAQALAVPFLAVFYLVTFVGALAKVFRPALKPLIGASLISRIYTGEAFKRPPRKHPIPAAVALGLAIVLIGPAVTRMPVAAAQDPQQAVVDLATSTVGSPYVFGAEGPNKFDCSGLVYWVFKAAGELPRIGGSRMGAKSYLRWFVSRGRWSKDEADARPGDLVVWKDGHHIGIYIGPNRVVSALNEKLGVRITDLHIPEGPSQYLLINWGTNDGGGGGDNGGGDNGGGDNGGGDPGNGNSGGDTGTDNPTPTPAPTDDSEAGNGASNGSTGVDNAPTPQPTAAPTPKPTVGPTDAPPPPGDNGTSSGQAISDSSAGTLPAATRTNPKPSGSNGVAIATVNLREAPDATSRILGWVGSGGYVTIIGTAFSPEGNLYYKVMTASGSAGWVYSHWVLRTQ